MSEQQPTIETESKTNKPNKLTRLADKAAKLEKELAETRKELKKKRQEKAALENAQAKKQRTRLLILGGLALAKSLQIATAAGKDQTTYWQGIFTKSQENQEAKSEKQRAKAAEDQRLFAQFIELAKAGTL